MRRCRFSNHPDVRVNAATMGDDAPSLELGDVDADVGMELILEKLKLLNYETEFCAKRKPPWPRLTRATFAIAENSSSDRDARFHHYAALAAFLVQLCGRRGHSRRGESDDQKTSAAAILHECAKLGFDPPEFSPSALTRASGKEAVGRPERPVRSRARARDAAASTAEAREGGSPGDGDVRGARGRVRERRRGARVWGGGAFADDDAENDDDDGRGRLGRVRGGVHRRGRRAEIPGELRRRTPPRTRKPSRRSKTRERSSRTWGRRGVEARARARRAAGCASSPPADAKDWRAHLESAREHRRSIAGTFPDVRVMLDGVVKDVAGALEKIETREGVRQRAARAVGGRVPDASREAGRDAARVRRASEATSSMTNELARLTEELEKVKGVIEDRGENNADATPLNTMKENMEKMREGDQGVRSARRGVQKRAVEARGEETGGDRRGEKRRGGKKKRRPARDDDTPY